MCFSVIQDAHCGDGEGSANYQGAIAPYLSPNPLLVEILRLLLVKTIVPFIRSNVHQTKLVTLASSLTLGGDSPMLSLMLWSSYCQYQKVLMHVEPPRRSR